MLLRKSISTTKRFFQKTLQNFKSFFSVGDNYQRIPKTSPYNPKSYSLGVDMNIQTTYKDLDKFYTDQFASQWESENENSKKKNIASSRVKQEKEVLSESVRIKFTKASPGKITQRRENHQDFKPKTVKRQEDSDSCSAGTREERSCLLIEKLKELELMDMSNVDHLLDIEEVLHYYSRLTCPAYVDIVDKFFMEIYAEFYSSSAAIAAHHIGSRTN